MHDKMEHELACGQASLWNGDVSIIDTKQIELIAGERDLSLVTH